jgi:predicted HAD superfamily Cof-like phosphohydrolase
MEGTNFELVGDFMEACDQQVLSSPTFPDWNTQELRVSLIEEEFKELLDGISRDDIVEVADALTDLLYVVYGAGHSFGIDLDACFAEVHRSNMTKLGPEGRAIKREDGKIMKPESYSPPDLESILKGA